MNWGSRRQRVIDPSEIIIEKEGGGQEDLFHANPWIRFLARFFDYALFLLLLLCLRKWLPGVSPFGKYESFIPFEFFIWIPIEALLLWFWGTTPGKFFLKMKLKQGRRVKLDFSTALRRSFLVWLRGLGMMIPIVNVICLLVAYYRLKALSQTSWDRDDHIAVTHAPVERWKIVFAVITAGIVFFLHSISKKI